MTFASFQKPYADYLRPALRQAMAAVIPGPRWARRHLVVSGLPRSGTSWIAKAMSLAPGVVYYFEPDSVLPSDYWNLYVSRGSSVPPLDRYLSDAFEGRIHNEYVIAEQGIRELAGGWRRHTVLVKWVKLVLCLDWLAERSPTTAVMQTIRHPVPLALSWRQRAWDPGHHLRRLLAQPALIEGPLAPYASIMRNAESFWEQTGAFWGAIATMQLRQHRPGWVLREHEWFCLNPAHHARELLQQLGLQWTDDVGDFITGEGRLPSGPGYGPNRDPQAEIHKWEKLVRRAEMDELEAVLRHFELPFYRNLDPEAFWRQHEPPLARNDTNR